MSRAGLRVDLFRVVHRWYPFQESASTDTSVEWRWRLWSSSSICRHLRVADGSDARRPERRRRRVRPGPGRPTQQHVRSAATPNPSLGVGVTAPTDREYRMTQATKQRRRPTTKVVSPEDHPPEPGPEQVRRWITPW